MIEGISYKVGDVKFRVYSETFGYDIGHYLGLSKIWKDDVIIGGYLDDKIYVVAVKNGKVIDKRAKVVLTKEDKKYYKPGDDFRTFKIDGLTILPVICLEILFSHIWKQVKEKVDIITFHVGFEMYNELQTKKWSDFQKSISRWFEAPLICAVGGDISSKNLDISGVIKWNK